MLATLARLFTIPALTQLPPLPEVTRAPQRPYRPPLFIGDVATPRGQVTELYHQLRRGEDGPQGPDELPR